MPHVHPEGVDLVVSVFVVRHFPPAVVLVDHKKLGGWHAIGGHVGDSDPYELPDDALAREIKEESGLTVQLRDNHPYTAFRARPTFAPGTNHNSVMQRQPWAVEMHDFPPLPGHKHLCLVYLAEVTGDDEIVLEKHAHREIRWFSHEDLERPEYRGRMLDTVRWYSHQAITAVTGLAYYDVDYPSIVESKGA